MVVESLLETMFTNKRLRNINKEDVRNESWNFFIEQTKDNLKSFYQEIQWHSFFFWKNAITKGKPKSTVYLEKGGLRVVFYTELKKWKFRRWKNHHDNEPCNMSCIRWKLLQRSLANGFARYQMKKPAVITYEKRFSFDRRFDNSVLLGY